MILKFKKDKRYTIHEDKQSENWFRVFFDGSMIALVMATSTARQVIYRHMNDNGRECEYLCDTDFVKDLRR